MSQKVVGLIQNRHGDVTAVQFSDMSMLHAWENLHPEVVILQVANLVTKAAVLKPGAGDWTE